MFSCKYNEIYVEKKGTVKSVRNSNLPLIFKVPASSVKIRVLSGTNDPFLYQVITGGSKIPSARQGRTATDPSGLV